MAEEVDLDTNIKVSRLLASPAHGPKCALEESHIFCTHNVHLVQVIVVGNGGVGKTSMIKRFCTGAFSGEYKKTIGVDFLQKKVFVPSQSETITMDLWDTAGQEEFDTLTRNYYRGAQACVIVFSTTDRASFVAVESWKEKVEREVQGLPILIVQNKVDQIESAVMTPKEAEDLSRKLGLKLYRTCVKDNTNVDAVFELLADLAMRPQAAAAPVKEHVSAATSSGGSAAAQPAAPAASSTASSNSGVVKPSKRSTFHNLCMYMRSSALTSISVPPFTPLLSGTDGKKAKLCVLL
jgi:Ras-related protein Rab-23